MNPIMQMISNSSPIGQIIGLLNSGKNPQELAMSIMQNNPQAKQTVDSMIQQCGNGNPKEYVLNYCRNNGIDENQVMQLAGKLGLK